MMRFIVDESSGPSLARWLREMGHEVFSVCEQSRGISDAEVIEKACGEDWILITNDKDFGEKMYREKHPHHGIVLLRLADERPEIKIETMRMLLSEHANRLMDNFVVVTETKVRFAKRRIP